ncbi:MAG: ComF family protein [Gammaproteobacteria bacterium]|nr:ComF family protein [Gammaproteobacteria bacterium]MCF6230015.1 ComF family protein [Gammaproteobacteria bacterium]
MVNGWLNYLHRASLSSRCVLCGGAGEPALDLCIGCQGDLVRINNPCRQCGLPLTGDLRMQCGRCLKQPPAFDRVISAYLYQKPFSTLVQALKFNARLHYSRVISHLMLEQIGHPLASLPELLIPVPLHVTRTRERGFNQALELARDISRQLKIELDFKSCQRLQRTQAQSDLDAVERLANMKNAFSQKNSLTARHVAIIDDVMTTGSTVNALAILLKNSGVEYVEVWVAARTV